MAAFIAFANVGPLPRTYPGPFTPRDSAMATLAPGGSAGTGGSGNGPNTPWNPLSDMAANRMLGYEPAPGPDGTTDPRVRRRINGGWWRGIIGLAALCVTEPVSAASYTWNGASTTTSAWSGSNWFPGTLPTSGTHRLVFTGARRPTNTATANYNLDGITFTGSAQSFTMQGNSSSRQLNMFGDVVNDSGILQTIGGTTTGTKLVLNYGTAAATRAINTGSGTIDMNAQINGGSAVTLSKTGSGRLVLDNPPGTGHGFKGTFRVSEGILDLQGSIPANFVVSSTSTITIDPAAASRQSVTVGSMNLSGTMDVIGSMTVNESLTLGSSSVTKFTLLVDPNSTQLLGYGDGSSFGGTLAANLLGDYRGADLFNPVVFQILQQQAGAATGNFSAVTATYDGATLSFTQGFDPNNPDTWVSGMTASGQYLTFDQQAGQMVVVPEPSTVVFAGIGAVMAGWHMLKERRRRIRLLRPACES